jgi:hypothetical protein
MNTFFCYKANQNKKNKIKKEELYHFLSKEEQLGGLKQKKVIWNNFILLIG